MRNQEVSIFKNWDKASGRKPVQELKRVHKAGLARAGSKSAIALAMALRPTGTTQPQIEAVLGSPYRNKLKQVVKAGHARKIGHTHNDAGHIVYKLALKV